MHIDQCRCVQLPFGSILPLTNITILEAPGFNERQRTLSATLVQNICRICMHNGNVQICIWLCAHHCCNRVSRRSVQHSTTHHRRLNRHTFNAPRLCGVWVCEWASIAYAIQNELMHTFKVHAPICLGGCRWPLQLKTIWWTQHTNEKEEEENKKNSTEKWPFVSVVCILQAIGNSVQMAILTSLRSFSPILQFYKNK